MIPWILALVLAFAASSFAPDQPWGEARDASGKVAVSSAADDARWHGRTSNTSVKLQAIAWVAVVLPRPVAHRLCVEHGGGHQVFRSPHSRVRGRAPPSPAVA